MHGKLRDSMSVVSVAIPTKLKEWLDKKVAIDPSVINRSDLIRKILLEYARHSISAEDFAEILAEINKTVKNRCEKAIFIGEDLQKEGLYTISEGRYTFMYSQNKKMKNEEVI